ncbi:MAG: TonB family protein [Acetobacteraceae bacterium]|jgi:protein TonB
MGPAALVSLGLHVALIGAAVLWMQRSAPVVLVPENDPATVQLVMSPPGGETPPAAAPQPEKPPAPESPQTAAATPQAPPAAASTTEDAPPPAAAPPPPAPPAPRAADNKLTFDFAAAESDTNALVTGDLMVPASPDVKFHNRKPSYPNEAVFRGEQGAVVLLIHVSPEGLVSGVDVVQSSGFAALDRAARDAVLTWHFLPSVKDGQPVPDEVPLRFVFALD